MASDIEIDSTSEANAQSSSRGAYSADVRLTLRAQSGEFFPSHVSHEELIFREPLVLEPSRALLIITIDDFERQSVVEILPHESPNQRIPIRTLESSSSGK